MRRGLCKAITLVSIPAFVALAVTTVVARYRSVGAEPRGVDGKTVWAVRIDGFHRIRRDAWPFPDLSRSKEAEHVKVSSVLTENDWFALYTCVETYYPDRDPESPPIPGERVASVTTRTLCVPFIPWLATLAMLALCLPISGMVDFLFRVVGAPYGSEKAARDPRNAENPDSPSLIS